MEPLIRIRNLARRYHLGTETIHALREVSLDIARGEYLAIMGPSGSGKSTLMNLVGCLDTPSGGSYELNGQRVSEMDDNQLAEIRNREIGFVFQSFNLFPHLTVEKNITLAPKVVKGMAPAEARAVAEGVLRKVGLAEKIDAYPDFELKGHVASFSPGTGNAFSILPAENATGNWVKVVQRIPVRTSVVCKEGDPPLRVGMSTSVEIDTGHSRGLSDLLKLVGLGK